MREVAASSVVHCTVTRELSIVDAFTPVIAGGSTSSSDCAKTTSTQ
jgi:hypothetical protein